MGEHVVLGSINIDIDAVDFETVTFDDAPYVQLTATKVQPAQAAGSALKPRKRRRADITLETGGVDARYTIDGTDPTTGADGVGHLVHDGDRLEINGHNNLSRFKIIGAAAGTSKAKVTYYE